MPSPLEAYQNTVFGLIRAFFLIGIAFGLFWTALGIADIALGLQWGYSWQIVLAGPAMALAAYLGYRFIGVIEKIVAALRG